jgi:hypothetical protein
MASAFPSFVHSLQESLTPSQDAAAHPYTERKRGLLSLLFATLIKARQREADQQIARLQRRSLSAQFSRTSSTPSTNEAEYAPADRKRGLLRLIFDALIDARQREAEEHARSAKHAGPIFKERKPAH